MFIAAIALAASLGGQHHPLRQTTSIVPVRHAQQTVAGPKVPLNRPLQLATDAQGDIFVANSAGNAIVVYGPSYARSSTI